MNPLCAITCILLAGAPTYVSTNDATITPRPIMDAGPIVSEYITIQTNTQNKAAGPFFELQQDAFGRTFIAFRPLFSRSKDPVRDHEIRDYLWPVASTVRNEDRTTWRVLIVYGRSWSGDNPPRSRWMLFPLVAYGRDTQGKPFFAMMPFGGEVREMFWKDSIRFVLFPLYMSTKINNQVTHSVLWPIVSWTHGEDSRRFRVFPFYGHSIKKDKWTRRFVLWPFWNSIRYEYPREQGTGFMLFPLVGRIKTNRQSTWMVIPPLFRWTKAENHREVLAPWPFVQYKRTENSHKLYLWPLWGKRKSETLDSSFFLWPLVRKKEARHPRNTSHLFHFFPFILSSSEYPVVRPERDDTAVLPAGSKTNTSSTLDPEVNKRYLRIWPLFSYQQEDKYSRLRFVDLWPFRRMRGIEQNWSALWTLYDRKRVDTSVETELLWGLFRRQKSAEGTRSLSIFPILDTRKNPEKKSSRWSLLKGLIAREQRGLHRRWTVLYFLKFGDIPDAPEPVPESDGASE